MKAFAAGLALLAWLFATPAIAANTLDLDKVACKDFLASGKENIAFVLMWMTGYYTDEDAPAVIDFDQMGKNAERLGDYCGKNPNSTLRAAGETLFDK